MKVIKKSLEDAREQLEDISQILSEAIVEADTCHPKLKKRIAELEKYNKRLSRNLSRAIRLLKMNGLDQTNPMRQTQDSVVKQSEAALSEAGEVTK